MAKIANAAYYGTTGKLDIGTDEYTAAVTSCALTPTTPKSQVVDIGGGVQAFVGKPTWMADIEYNQDWKTATSLSQILISLHGQTKIFKYTPASGGQIATFTALIEVGRMGGAANSLHNASVSLQVIDQPTFATT